ncbi:MAG: hypothetical protein JWN48_4607 [Myxococcaceae bacterium]|nr:hypothetical protein [Myxococcaceae bacterium]
MKTNRLFALGLITALASGACGDDSGSKPTPAGGGGKDSGTITLADGAVVPVGGNDSGVTPGLDGGNGNGGDGSVPATGTGSATITSAGGSVTSTDGNLTLTFSRYAYKRPTLVTITVASAPPAGAKGTVYNLSPKTEPFGDQNNPIVTATLRYTAADLAGGTVQDLKVGQFVAGRWTEVVAPQYGGVPTKANPAKMTITAQIHSLAPVALLGGLCVDCVSNCASTTAPCTYMAPGSTDGQAGKCVVLPGTSNCLVCRPAADDDNDGFPNSNDCALSDPKINLNAVELCNGVDDYCNFHTDEGCTPCKADADCKISGEWCREGFCDTQICDTCTPGNCFVGQGNTTPGTCHKYGVNDSCSKCVATCDTDGDGQCAVAADPAQVDCKEGDPTVYRGAPEICGNNVDDNCDTHIDENCSTCKVDADCPTDGFACVGGACLACPAACDAATCAYNGTPGQCEPYGKGCSRCINVCDTDKDGFCGAMGQDCQEGSNPAVNNGALEVCGNNVDDNCDSHIDEGCNTCTKDTDCTGFPEYCNALGACDACPQTQCDPATCVWPQNQPATTPTLPGKCGTYAKGCARCGPPEGSDVDGDGYPSQMAVTAAKMRTPSVDLLLGTITKVDCDDAVATVNPGTAEVCGNMIDDDCNGKKDDLCTTCETSMMCGAAEVCDSTR